MDKNIRVLIVDDSSLMREVLKKQLGTLGFHNTLEADDGSSALPLLETADVELLITGWSMPGIAGLELVRILRRDKAFMKLPILMLTAASSSQQQQALAAGVNSCLHLPPTVEALKQAIALIFPGLHRAA